MITDYEAQICYILRQFCFKSVQLFLEADNEADSNYEVPSEERLKAEAERALRYCTKATTYEHMSGCWRSTRSQQNILRLDFVIEFQKGIA